MYHQSAAISQVWKREQLRLPTKLSPICHHSPFAAPAKGPPRASRVDAPRRVQWTLADIPLVLVNIAHTTVNGAHAAYRAATEPKP